jgi:RNA polymerase sigma-70 factor, ECF subfamily
MDDDPQVTEYLRQARQGDTRKLAELLDQQRPRLRRMVQLRLDRRLQGRVDPSDVIQEAFLEATTRLQDYLSNPSLPFGVWLRFITFQKLLTLHRHHLRTQSRDASREIAIFTGVLPEASSIALARQLLGHLTSPSQAALKAERKLRLEDALNRMQEIDREVLLLRHFEELGNLETASVLGISPTAANNRYVRALKRLKDTLLEMSGMEEGREP